MGAWAANQQAKIQARLLNAAEGLSLDIANDVRQRVSVPVGRRGKTVVIRSKPGEPPRRETGGYLSSWRSRAGLSGEGVTAKAVTEGPLGNWLEKGTKNMVARPHAEKTRQAFLPEAKRRFAKAVVGK